MKINIHDLFPPLYHGIAEIDALAYIENSKFKEAESDLTKLLNNQFVVSSDEDGLVLYENILGIVSNPVSDSIDFRKARIINRLSSSAPFTYRFLCNKLDELLGKDQWQAFIDFDNYTLTVESAVKEQIWLEEILFTMTKIKPCNILFINKPLLPQKIIENELILYDQEQFNYRLGNWALGKLSFRSIHEKGVLKMEKTSSVTKENLLMLSRHLVEQIAMVRLNDHVLIDTWEVKDLIDDIVTVEYRVDVSHGLGSINKIELLNAEQVVLTSATVYVPVIEPVIVKHRIGIKEG